MYLDRSYRTRRRRRGIGRFWPLFVLAALAIIFYEEQPTWLVPKAIQPTPVPARSAISYLTEAKQRLWLGDYLGALESNQQLASLEPQNPAPFIAQAELYLTLLDLPEARRMAERAVALEPENVDALTILSRVLDWQGEYEESLDYGLDALDIEPNNAETLAVIGEIYTDVGNWSVAEDYLTQALELDSDNVTALRNRAYLYENLGDYDNAITFYDQAIVAAPYRFDLYIERGRQYRVGLFDYEKANESYREAVEVYRSAVTLDALGYGLYNNMDHLQAVRVLKDAVEMDSRYGPALIHLGMALYARRNYEDAAPMLERGIEILKERARIEHYYTLGLAHIYKDPSECEKAEPWLQAALEMDAYSKPALEGLGLCQ